MDTKTVYITVAVILVGAVIGLALFAVGSSQKPVINYYVTPEVNLAGYIPTTIDIGSTTVSNVETLVYSPSNDQYLKLTNLDSGQIDCGWKTTSTLDGTAGIADNGFHIDPAGSSTLNTFFETRDQTFLKKFMFCIADTTSTFAEVKY